jgi:hypothetical protein
VCESTPTKQQLLDLEEEMTQYFACFGKDLVNINKERKLRIVPSKVDKETDVLHIEIFIHDDDRAKRNEYVKFIAKEGRICNIPIMGSCVLEWQDTQRACVLVERWLHLLVQLNHQYELREYIGEKIANMIIYKGLDICHISSKWKPYRKETQLCEQ